MVIRFIGPAEMFGCVAAFGGGRYPGTATAVEDGRVIGWTRIAARHPMARHPRAVSRSTSRSPVRTSPR